MIDFLFSYGRQGLVLILLALPIQVFAWGDDGHQIVGAIAYSRLTPSVKNKVDALLAADTDDLTAPDFISRTTWADKYRDSDRSSTGKRYEATRHWHFVNIEIVNGQAGSACNHHPKLVLGMVASAGPAQACIIDKIDQFISELRNRSIAKTEKNLALKFLLHLVGDLHQPMHTADNWDRGGNDVAVLYGERTTPDNLHSYWDHYLVRGFGDDPRVVGASLNRQISKAKADLWSNGTPSDWAMQSFGRAKSVAYNLTGQQTFTDERGVKTIRLDQAYENHALTLAREQLAKAGVRLAAVLNLNLK